MPAEELRKMLMQQPFVPFRIYLSDGRVFDVRHREMVWVGRGFAIVGLFALDGYLDQDARIALDHIVSLEPIQATQQAG